MGTEEKVQRITSKQRDKLIREPSRYILLCGICRKPIGRRIRKEYEYAEPDADVMRHKQHGECHEKCYIAALPRTKRAKYLASVRTTGSSGYVL